MENVAILARVPSALRQCAALCAELNHRALRDTLILNSPFSILHFQKVLHNGCSLRCQNGFRMKLHAVNRHGLMPYGHDLSSFVTRDDLEALRQRIRCSDQRMIARCHRFLCQTLEQRLVGIHLDDALLAVHELLRVLDVCKACERICPQNAIKFVGESITSSKIMEILLRDRDYYLNSGGGVTFSGGEAFTQFEGLMDLLIQCKNEKLHTSVETCGQVNLDKIKQALPLIDLFLFDIKHTDKDLLQKETGANLDTILTNLRYISSKSANKVTIRVPVIPGFNFNENTLREIFMLAKENRIKCVHLLPYHTLGKDKYEQLGLTYPYPCEQMLAKEELFPFKEMGEKMGLEIRIGG